LDDCKEGLIPKKELREAVKKVAKENDIEMDDKTLSKIVDDIYKKDNGAKQSTISR
jgi:Ca2+-binding EF-hand superfamily protein